MNKVHRIRGIRRSDAGSVGYAGPIPDPWDTPVRCRIRGIRRPDAGSVGYAGPMPDPWDTPVRCRIRGIRLSDAGSVGYADPMPDPWDTSVRCRIRGLEACAANNHTKCKSLVTLTLAKTGAIAGARFFFVRAVSISTLHLLAARIPWPALPAVISTHCTAVPPQRPFDPRAAVLVSPRNGRQ